MDAQRQIAVVLARCAVFCPLLACASHQGIQRAVDPNAPDGSAIVVRFESAGNVLDGLRARIPAMTVTYPSNDCPRIMFRGRTSGRNQGNPTVYVDGTRMQDTCILSQINVADVDHVEVLPSGDTSRAGIPRNPAGLILVFRLRQ